MVFGLYLDKTQLDLKLPKQMFVSHLSLLCCHKWFLPLWLFLSHLIDQLKILYWCPSPDHTRTLKKKKSVKFDYGTWSKGNSIRSLVIKLIIWRPLTVDVPWISDVSWGLWIYYKGPKPLPNTSPPVLNVWHWGPVSGKGSSSL